MRNTQTRFDQQLESTKGRRHIHCQYLIRCKMPKEDKLGRSHLWISALSNGVGRGPLIILFIFAREFYQIICALKRAPSTHHDEHDWYTDQASERSSGTLLYSWLSSSADGNKTNISFPESCCDSRNHFRSSLPRQAHRRYSSHALSIYMSISVSKVN